MQLLLGGGLVQPTTDLERALVGLDLVQPIVSLCEADRPLADAQKTGALTLRAAHRMPAPFEKEDAALGVEPVGHQRIIGPEQVNPGEAGPLQQIDLCPAPSASSSPACEDGQHTRTPLRMSLRTDLAMKNAERRGSM